MSLHTELSPEVQERLRKEKAASTAISIAISVLSIVVLGALLALLAIAIPQQKVDTIISYQPPNQEEEQESNKPKVQTNQRQVPTPPAASSSVANVITSASVSNVSVPDAQTMTSVESIDFGEIDDFGMDASFEDSMSSETSFFGAKMTGNRICYVIDYSASMAGLRDNLMRKELTKSVKKLKGGAQYNLIFFSGPVWRAGDKAILDGARRSGVITNREGNSFKWEGSNDKGWFPKGKKQKMEWIKPNKENIDQSIKDIEDTPLVFGTYWEAPLEYALDMDPKPDVVVFMTDGSSGDNSLAIAEDMGKLARRRGIVVNTISLMEPTAKEGMLLLAEETGGSATMVMKENEIIDLATGEIIPQ